MVPNGTISRRPRRALTLSDDQLLMPAQSGSRSTLPGRLSCFGIDRCASCVGCSRSWWAWVSESASDAPAQGKKLKIGVIYDYTGPLAGGGSELHALGAKIMIDYFIKKGGVEGYQTRGRVRRRAEQAGRRHQRGGAADRAGEGRHAARLLLVGAVRAGGRAGRAAQEVHVDHHVHLLGGARESPPEIRLPDSAERQAVRADVDGLPRAEREEQAGQGAEGSPRRDHPRGRRLRRRRLARQRGRRQEGRLQLSC